MIGIYIHIPFCLRKCSYCDFYSLPYTGSLANAYTDALVRAIRSHPYGSIPADTLYFGGGTPSLLGTARLSRILDAVADAFSLASGTEITLETNPATITREDFVSLFGAGFNRLSVGVQTLSDAELAALGRLHSADDAKMTIYEAADAGFTNISADLMLAIPGQTRKSLADTVSALCDLPVSHISAYLLKIEEDTPFYTQKSALALTDDDTAAERYLECIHLLNAHGFRQYEISNFSRGNSAARHNLKYWRCEPYLGIGPAAHSFVDGKRFYFPRDLAAFIACNHPFELTVPDGDGGDAAERILLGLRLCEGIEPARHLSPQGAEKLLQKARELEGHGLVTISDRHVALTPQGFLLSNTVIAALLDAAQAHSI